MIAGLALATAALVAPAPASAPAALQEARLGVARATLAGDRLTLTTGRITRDFRWNGGHLVATMIRDEARGSGWALAGDAPDITLPDVTNTPVGPGRFSVRRIKGDAIEPPHLLVVAEARLGTVTLRRSCRLFEHSPAIGCTVQVAGAPPSAFARAEGTARGMIEDDAGGARGSGFVTDRLALPGAHWRADHIRFATATDHADNLVARGSSLLFREDQRVAGNILILRPQDRAGHLFVLKEAPVATDQLGWPGHDFLLRNGDVRVAGSGFSGAEAQDASVDAYAVVVGVAGPSESDLRLALRAHMETVRRFDIGRDAMIMSNSWGDRSRDARMSEAFIASEIDAAARLGLTHVQLDDGWQAGLSRNSANRAGERWEDWSAADWRPHPKRFPGGLSPLVERAAARGVRLGLWFNPSQVDDYAAWQRDADILIDYWRRYRIASVKIDGVNVPSKRAEANLTAFFERIRAATAGEMVINMDVTAGRRPGYFSLNRYGNIFLENRYTDWGNYYPHRSLRNLWMLAAWVPPQWLQIEFLNVARNRDRYADDDRLAPGSVGQQASFAATLAAQPLAWMELTGLDPIATGALTDAIARYRRLQAEWQAGRILPIGDEPDGAAWTGFQSIAPGGCGGLLILYREPLAPETGELAITPPSSEEIVLERVDDGPVTGTVEVVRRDLLRASLAEAGSHSIWRYRTNRSDDCNKTDMTIR